MKLYSSDGFMEAYDESSLHCLKIMVTGDKGNIVLTKEEVSALIAALNYTKPRSNIWLPIDEDILNRLLEMQRNYNAH